MTNKNFLTIRQLKKLARINKLKMFISDNKEDKRLIDNTEDYFDYQSIIRRTCVNLKTKNIFMSIKQLKDLCHSFDFIQHRGFKADAVLIQAFLHELAHWKHFVKLSKKFNNKLLALNYFEDNFQYCEDLADRYALIYYKQYINKINKMEHVIA